MRSITGIRLTNVEKVPAAEEKEDESICGVVGAATVDPRPNVQISLKLLPDSGPAVHSPQLCPHHTTIVQ